MLCSLLCDQASISHQWNLCLILFLICLCVVCAHLSFLIVKYVYMFIRGFALILCNCVSGSCSAYYHVGGFLWLRSIVMVNK